MTVKELINELKRQDGDAEVGFAYGYGDHWNTTVVGSIKVVDEMQTVHSDYHGTAKIPEEIREDDDPKTMVILASYL
jgi:hypothetical protein